MLDRLAVKAIAEYLCTGERHKIIFESVYWMENAFSCDSAERFSPKGDRESQLMGEILETLPKYAIHSLPYAMLVSNRLMRSFLDLDNSEEENLKIASDNAKEQIKTTNEIFGLFMQPNGRMQQEEIQQAICNKQERELQELIQESHKPASGLKALKAGSIARVLRKQCERLPGLRKTLNSVSIISESLLRGLEKIKSSNGSEGYEYGRDLSCIDARELSYLKSPETKQLFKLKYAKGELLQETREERKMLGDMIIATDTSSSTDSLSHANQCTVLSLEMGITYAISQLAAKNKCKCRLILYNSSPYLDSEWLRSKKEVGSHIGSLYENNQFNSGGTDFNSALEKMIAIARENQFPAKRKPVLIFITDGAGDLSSEIMEQVEQLKISHGIKLLTYFVSHSDPRCDSKKLCELSSSAYWVNANINLSEQVNSFIDLT